MWYIDQKFPRSAFFTLHTLCFPPYCLTFHQRGTKTCLCRDRGVPLSSSGMSGNKDHTISWRIVIALLQLGSDFKLFLNRRANHSLDYSFWSGPTNQFWKSEMISSGKWSVGSCVFSDGEYTKKIVWKIICLNKHT